MLHTAVSQSPSVTPSLFYSKLQSRLVRKFSSMYQRITVYMLIAGVILYFGDVLTSDLFDPEDTDVINFSFTIC